MIEGGGSKSFAEIKKMAFSDPVTLHALLDKLATTIITYVKFQIESGADVISIDWRISIAEARRRVGDRVALQGNLDPCVLLGPQEGIAARAKEILEEAGPLGHILNLGHGILPPTPVENARAFIQFGQSFRHTK
jgi:uroporphyrinogen-III decarboxylase